MAPNIKDKEEGRSSPPPSLGEESPYLIPKKEILYDGYYYDVTSFIERHPGGTVIDYYTVPGEDATVPILEFHNRAKDRVDKIMRSLPRRKAPEHESK